MHRTKALLAILVAALVSTVVPGTAPARAEAVALNPEQRTAQLAVTTSSLHRQIKRLSRRAITDPHDALSQRQVSSCGRRVISLTRGANGLNRYTLGLADVDEATYSRLLDLDAQVLNLDRDVRRLNQKVLPQRYRSLSRKLGMLADQLHTLDATVRDCRQALSTPTPTPTTTPTPTPTPTGVPGRTYNVMDYGAKANGTTDDVAAVQTAVNACAAAGGGTVYMPDGNYYFHAGHCANSDLGCCVELKTGVHILGESRSGTVISWDTGGASAIGATQNANIGIGNLTIQGLTPVHGVIQDCIKLYACTGVAVDSVTARDAYIGIALYDTINGVVANCLAYSMTDAGISMGTSVLNLATGTNNLFVDCEAYGCADAAFRVAGADQLAPVPRRFTDCALTNCYGYDSLYGLDASYCGDMTVTDFRGSGNGSYDIFLGGVATATITGSSGSVHELVEFDGETEWLHYGPCSNITVD